jgi:2-dehydropantoate 2-reductase
VHQTDWPAVAVVGSGAVGCYFGGMLARAGAPVTLIGRPQHVEAFRRDGLRMETARFQESVAVAASTDLAAARGAQLVLFCVKSIDSEPVAKSLAPHLAPDALILDLQNGVDNVARICRQLPNAVVAAVVYVACEMIGPGRLKHHGRGDLVIGALGAGAGQGAGHAAPTRAQLEALAGMLAHADIPAMISDNIEGELWLKFLINCAYNAISALGRSRYARMTGMPESRAVMEAAVGEVLAVAKAAGVRMPGGDLVARAIGLADAMPQQLSSMAQDLARGRRTEIDDLNGLVARRGRELGVPTPVNATLHAMVKLLEFGGPDPA